LLWNTFLIWLTMRGVAFVLACLAATAAAFNPSSLQGNPSLQQPQFQRRVPSNSLVARPIEQLQKPAVAMATDRPVGWKPEQLEAPVQPELDQQLLSEAYDQCEKVTQMASKTFSFGASLLEQEKKKAMWAIYTWCRRTDDLVDSPLAMMDSEKMTSDLAAWRARLNSVWQGEATDALDLTLLDTRMKYPSLSIEPFLDMIEGMKMDTPQFGQNRYKTWDDLYLYCYRVASTVGLMSLPIFGTAPGYTEEQAKSPAIALGIGLQITNILRDVGEDARRGRIYLPQEDMERFNVTERQILNNVLDDNYIKLMKFEIQRARDYYKEAQDGIPMLAPAARLGVQAASDIYSQILNKVEDNGYDNFRFRAYVKSNEKLSVLLSSWWTVNAMPETSS